jgi:hypothetical protein
VKKSGKRVKFIAALVLTGLLTCFLADKAYALNDSAKVNVSLLGKYDSADTASIRSVDLEAKKIRFRNHATGRTYTLSYDNTSMMYDAYDAVLSPGRLEQGQIVDVTFLKSTKHITTLNVSKEAWVIENTRKHELVRNDGTALIKDGVYKIDSRALVIAEDQPALAEDILATDTIRVRGIDKEIYSVVVTGGHGYVSLSSDTVEDRSLIGAWIELDNEVIHKISPNMMLSAPEGDYKLQIIGNGANYQSEVNVARNQETVVDTSNIVIERPKEGLVQFDITPDTAEVFVDGKRMLTGVPQSIQYGYHNLKIMAKGYITQSKYLKVGTPNSVIQIELEKDEDASASSSSSESEAAVVASTRDNRTDNSSENASKEKKETVSSNSSESGGSKKVSENSSDDKVNKLIEGYRIYFDEPEDVEVYFDGSYVGIIPAHINKISGTHEVILKKAGYKTKSYRISIDTSKSDLSYSFPPLVKNKKDDSDPGSGSSASTGSTSHEEPPLPPPEEPGTSEDSGASEESSDDSASSISGSSNKAESGSEASSGANSSEEEAGDAASTASGEN